MRRVIVVLACVAIGLAACDTGPNLDVRTFELQYIEPGAAATIIDPYVSGDRGGDISVQQETGVITVRESPEMLDRIGEVLAKYDRPEPGVRLHFRLIEANGQGTGTDPELQEIRDALPENVFRFKNYRQIAEAVMTGIEHSSISQAVSSGGTLEQNGPPYHIEGQIGEIRASGDSGTVQLQIALRMGSFEFFTTAVNARLGQLLVVGSAQPLPDRGALILTVRPELDRQ